MNTQFKPSIFFLLFIFQCMIHGNFCRKIAGEAEHIIETSYDNDHLCVNHHTHDDDEHVNDGCQNNMIPHHIDHGHSSSSQMDLSWNIFFHINDLKLGKKIPLYFPIKNSSITPHMISKQEAEQIPFSSSQLPEILKFFSFPQNSPQAKAIKHTLIHCEIPPLKGETKFCATSLESMLDNLALIFGLGTNFKVLTTTHLKNMIPNLQNYTILEDPKEIITNKVIACHPVPYPYSVYYCHGQVSDNRLFMISLKGEKDDFRFEAIAICHMDTSQWDPHHVSFHMLRIEPGTSPVCHVFPQDNLVWVSTPSSSN
ncbi:BURP domain protein USPL1-like [Amaranthus tricolor]|uniref:BURP domain protein USPL1-like n=1 Tax=Amaranthus tricolor TaxID=29722 RepID=UPI00258F9C67|nr:BURP domain protein USPL1-like [Amaranthus tricolor]